MMSVLMLLFSFFRFGAETRVIFFCALAKCQNKMKIEIVTIIYT